jgi:hypothetical protein
MTQAGQLDIVVRAPPGQQRSDSDQMRHQGAARVIDVVRTASRQQRLGHDSLHRERFRSWDGSSGRCRGGTSRSADKDYCLGAVAEPARKHGISDDDILHAVRTAIRKMVMDEDLTMLIGPAADGALLEIGVPDLDGDDPVGIHAMPLRPRFHRFLG